MQARHRVIVSLLVVALAGALYSVNHWGLALKRTATESWLQKAGDESQRITDTSLYWLSLSDAQLRGLATLFYGSHVVTEDKFLDALELIEGVETEAVIPLTTLAYAEQRAPDTAAVSGPAQESRFPVKL